MRYVKKLFPCILLLSFLVLTGCSGSNAGSDTAAKDQFAPAASNDTTPTPTGTGTVLSYNLTLNTVGASGGGATVGPGGTVVATAILVDSAGNPVANQPVKFEKVDTLAPVTITNPIINTDSNGKSINFLKADNIPGSSSSSYNVIIKASTSVNGQLVTSLTIFTVSSGTVLSYNLTLNTVGASGNGATAGPLSTVVATASLSNSSGQPVAGQDIAFRKIDSAAPVTISSSVIKTDSNGNAINFLTVGNLPSTSSSSYDVIIEASTTVNGEYVTSLTIFKVLRSAGNVINFITSKSPTDPDGTLNRLAVTLKNVDPASQPSTGIVQLVPFEVLDRNGNPMPRQQVAVSIYSTMGGAGCTAFIDSPELPAVRTVTTDDNGKGIFNAIVSLATPGVGSQNSCSIIYRATTTLVGLPDPPVFSYGGFIASVTNEPPI